MKDKIFISKNTLIASLLFLSAILTACWAAIGDNPFQYPVAGSSRAGFFVVTTTVSGTVGPDLLWVANRNTQQLTVYGAKSNGAVSKLATADLGQQFRLRSTMGY